MKSIILVALLCATVLALPSKPVEQKTNLIEIFKEKVSPKLASLPVHKITRANLVSFLKGTDNEIPGLKECVDQFIASAEGIYNWVNRAADRLVPLFQKYNLNEVIQAELPQLVERVSLRTYEGLAEAVQYQHDLGAPDDEVVGFFIVVGIYFSAAVIPSQTCEELHNLISGINVEAGNEFMNIFNDLYYDSGDQIFRFLQVLVYAILGLGNM